MARLHREDREAQPRHDPGYKRIFSHSRMVEELIRGFLHGDWIERLDFSTLEKVSHSFVSADLRERHSDLIWRLRLHGDEDRWVYLYLLLEFQSTSDPFMAVRLLTYVGLLLEDIIRKENLKTGDRLPAVLPVVLHSGSGRWRAPLRLETHFVPVPKDLRRYLPRLTYLLLDERRLDLDRPELEHNPTAAFFQVEVNETAEALRDLCQQLKDRIPPGDSELLRTVNEWLAGVIRRMVPGAIMSEGTSFEEPSMLEENLRRWNDEARKEGRREGQIQARREVLLEQMTLRFGHLPANVRRQIEGISSLQELRKLGRKVLRAKTLQDMGLGHDD
jgi:predicted transposase/invertase (TIGR01784 family)